MQSRCELVTGVQACALAIYEAEEFPAMSLWQERMAERPGVKRGMALLDEKRQDPSQMDEEARRNLFGDRQHSRHLGQCSLLLSVLRLQASRHDTSASAHFVLVGQLALKASRTQVKAVTVCDDNATYPRYSATGAGGLHISRSVRYTKRWRW